MSNYSVKELTVEEKVLEGKRVRSKFFVFWGLFLDSSNM